MLRGAASSRLAPARRKKSQQRSAEVSLSNICSTHAPVSVEFPSPAPACAGEPATATFVPYNPAHTKSGLTILPEGVVHIFRDYSRNADELPQSPSTYASAAANGSTPQPVRPEQPSDTNVESDDLTLAVLAVPSWMAPSDFLAFVAPAADGIAHLRMIRYVHSICRNLHPQVF